MIVRLIVFVAIFVIGWWLYRQFIAFKRSQSAAKSQNKASSQETMIRCEECQTLTPRSHGVFDPQGRTFCCKEHLDEFNQKH